MKEIKRIEETNEHCTSLVKINGVRERLQNRHRIPSNKNATGQNDIEFDLKAEYNKSIQDINENKTKSRGKNPVKMNTKPKLQMG